MIRFYSNFNDRFKKNKRCRTVNLEKTQGHGENHPFAITSDCEHILHVCAKKKFKPQRKATMYGVSSYIRAMQLLKQ